MTPLPANGSGASISLDWRVPTVAVGGADGYRTRRGLAAAHGAAAGSRRHRTPRGRARTRGITVNTLMQMSWALILSRMTDRSDVVFGVTVSGRPA
ncbi:hypothetical protein H7I76_34405, partial [Mycolicibacterium vaccae]|nr:hypothetical protein [Mycolicibacterium vaccae]